MSSNKDNLINKVMKKLLSREVITYLIAGGLTTVVNFVVYGVLFNYLDVANMLANTIAWVVAVIFAYIVNNYWVFQNDTSSGKKEGEKLVKFFSARIVTLIVESAGMFFFIDVLKLYQYNMIVKGFIAIIVIVLNYIFSKLFVFDKNTKTSENTISVAEYNETLNK